MSEEKRKTSAELREELEALEAEQSSLRQEHARCEARMKDIDNRLSDLRDWRGMGEISRTLGRIAAAERWEQDQTATKVRVISTYSESQKIHALVKVTAKRIYTREIGSHREEYWTSTGESGRSYISYRIHPDDVAEIHRREIQG